MKIMPDETWELYSRILRTLRARGDRPGFPEMAAASDIATALEQGDTGTAEARARALGLSLAEITDGADR